jgi:amino acid transporter
LTLTFEVGGYAPPVQHEQNPALKRAVTRPQVVALAVNAVIGSGIYLLPAAAAALLGRASLAAVAVAAAAVLLVVLCFAEAASHFDRTGGAYLYTRAAFGDLVGFEVGWMTWLARVASAASLSAGFAQALSFLWAPAAEGWGRAAAVALPLLALTAVNVAGVRFGADTAVALVLAKSVPLVVFAAAGAAAFVPRTFLSQVATRGAAGAAELGEAALLLLFAYAGFENTAAPAGEYRDPRRDVPFALVAQLALVTALYLAVQAVALGTLPDLGTSASPLAEAAGRFLGAGGIALLSVGAVVSILGTLNDSVLAGPRYLFALAEDGFGPAFLARVHPRWRTPAAAILLQTAIALPLALTGSFVGLAALSVVARLATYLGTAAAVPVLRRRWAGEGEPEAAAGDGARFDGEARTAAARSGGGARPWRLPGGPAIPAAAALVTLGLAASATVENLLAAGAALLAGLLLYALRRRPA